MSPCERWEATHMINKYGDTPLYIQLKNLIIEKIKNGEYKENSKIPSEQEFCEMYDISRPTVRQAISDLTNSGYLYKEKGKGTFVSEAKLKIDIKDYSGFTDSILDSDMPGERSIIFSERIDIRDNQELCAAFGVSPGHNAGFAKIVYVNLRNDSPIALNVSYIPLNLFPSIIEDINANKPAYDIMRGKYPLLPSKSSSSLEVIYAGQEESRFLKVQQGHPLICIKNKISSKSGQTVEYVVSKYRADKCKMFFENAR